MSGEAHRWHLNVDGVDYRVVTEEAGAIVYRLSDGPYAIPLQIAHITAEAFGVLRELSEVWAEGRALDAADPEEIAAPIVTTSALPIANLRS